MNRISAKIVADSLTNQGHRITTLEVIFPRFILAEFNTHRLFSRNSASSRAIPFNKMLKSIETEPFIPIAWQADHKGMQGTQYLTEPDDIEYAIGTWLHALDSAVEEAKILHGGAGVTKQLVNRLLEPFMYHKVLITATEFDNFYELRSPAYSLGADSNIRSKKDAHKLYPNLAASLNELDWFKINKGMGEIHIMDLAEKMWDAMNESTPKLLNPGEWHIPYGDKINLDDAELGFDIFLEQKLSAKIQISVARCARLSYQTLGDNPVIDYQKDFELYNTLKESGHFSPFEHVARAMTDQEYYSSVKGLSTDSMLGRPVFQDKDFGWNNNFRGFMQFRWLLENNQL